MKAICYTEITQKIPFDFVYFHSKENEEPLNLEFEVVSSKDELELRKFTNEEILIIEVDKDSHISVYTSSNPLHQNFTYELSKSGIYIYRKEDDTADIFKKFEVISVNLSELFSRAEEISLLKGQDENNILEENENKWNKLIVPPKSPSPKLLRNGENNGYTRSSSPSSFNNCGRSSPFKSPTKTDRECCEKDNFNIRVPLSVRPVNLDLTYG